MLRWSLLTRRTLGGIIHTLGHASDTSAAYHNKGLATSGSCISSLELPGTVTEQPRLSSSVSSQQGHISLKDADMSSEPAVDPSLPIGITGASDRGDIRVLGAPELQPIDDQLVPASQKALVELRHLLSNSNIHSSNPIKPTATRLRRLYMRCRLDPRLLTPKERSGLISLYGTLSLPVEMTELLENPHPLATHMRHLTSRPWWSFIWLLIQDQRAGGGLTPEDLAWHFSALRATNGTKGRALLPPSLLSLASALLESPTLDAAYDFRHIYTRSASQLRWSERLDHTELARFYGTLAFPADAQSVHAHPAAEKIKGQGHFDWSFVKTLLRDKRRVKELSPEDMYWVVVTRARGQGLAVEYVDPDVSSRLYDLRSQRIGAFLKELHDPGSGLASYIEGLLNLQTDGATNEAVAWICALGRRHTLVQPSLQHALWHTVLRDNTLSEANQNRLLGVAHARLFEVKTAQALPAPAAESEHDDGIDTSFHKPPPLQAEDFLLRVCRHVFPIDRALDGQSPSQIVVKNWTRYLAQIMFDPKLGASTRWMNLAYLAFAATPTTQIPQAVSSIRISGHDNASLHPVDLRAVVLLTVFERLASSGQLQPEMGPIIERLWRLWALSVREHITVHSPLVRPLLASFFMLAGHLRDPALLHRMLELSHDKSWIWAFDFGDDPAREQVRALVTAYITASALCGHVVWEEIIAGVPNYAAFPQWVPSLLGAALVRLARVEPRLASDLRVRWGVHVDLPRQTLAPLALALANAQEPNLAIPLLPLCDYRQAEALQALGAVLLPLAHAAEKPDAQTIEALSGALKAAAKTADIPLHMRGRFTWLLFQLLNAGRPYVDIATAATAAIQTRNPRFFDTTQVGGLVRSLLHRRFFKHALTLLERVNGHYPRRAVSAWTRTAVIASVRSGRRDFVPANRSSATSRELIDRAKVLITYPGIKRDPYFSVLAHDPDVRKRWRKALQLSSRLREYPPHRSPASSGALRAVLAMRGEKKLMSAIRPVVHRLSKRELTILGNVLLRHWVHKRDRRVRTDGNVAATIETLKTALGFTPDRITLNILVGRALRRSTCPTRALFDELIRRGYPSLNGPPFEIPWRDRPQNVLSLLEEIPGRAMSYVKHVRPLYKTFIRAFARKGDLEGMRAVVGALKYAQEQHRLSFKERRMKQVRRASVDVD
ncbi:unnamed protein product [Peniophora sp. CBMAI 1063]|nr:unnamed protein product [Peniophora sp. CBMAI 1063]